MVSLNLPLFFLSFLFKMWIYSLGRTLMKTMPTISPLAASEHSMQQQHHSSIVLQATIWKMCKDVEERASLMFLLNVSINSCTYYIDIPADTSQTMWNIFEDEKTEKKMRKKIFYFKGRWRTFFLILQYSPSTVRFPLCQGKIYEDRRYVFLHEPKTSLNLPARENDSISCRNSHG